jgi:zinc and cadmium transporter
MTLLWIIGSGLLMSAISLVGGALLLLPERVQRSLHLPLVAFAAGSLFGGAAFHMFPSAYREMGGGVAPVLWLAAGFAAFALLERALKHHHHPSETAAPVVWMVLLADGLHNLLGGLSVATAFLIDIKLGMAIWLVEAAHEVPQEFGDFAVLVHGGLSKVRALLYNLLSGLMFPIGGLIAYGFSTRLDLAFLLAFGAGNFLYLACVDLLPDILGRKVPGSKVPQLAGVVAGVALLLVLRSAVDGLHPHP